MTLEKKNFMEIEDKQCDTDDLMQKIPVMTQTKLSFSTNKRYRNFMVDTKELASIWKKSHFAKNLRKTIEIGEGKHIFRNEKMEQKLKSVFVDDDFGYSKNDYGFPSFNKQGEMKEILEDYAWVSKQKVNIMNERNELKKRNDILESTCLKFKGIISQLDSKYKE